MRLTAVAPVVLAIAPAAVSALGTLGFALGTKHPDGSCKSSSDYTDDFATLKAQSTLVRGYAASDCDFAKNILPAASSAGFNVILGIWPDTDESYNDDKAAVEAAVKSKYADHIYAITVGSETLYRGNFTGEELLKKIQDVKTIAGNIPVGTADSWNKYADGTADAVVKGADIVLCNAFSYWQGQEIKNASSNFFDDIYQALGRVQSVNENIKFMVGETGWPTGGSNYEAAVPGVKQAEQFWKDGICGIREWGVDVFAFEAFDEPWKPKSVGQNGQGADETQWGVFKADRTQKYDLGC